MASYNDEKRELLKMKQGLIEESDIIETDVEKAVIEKPTGMAAVENFIYHYKWFILVGLFFTLVVGFLVHQTLTREAADMTVVLVTSDVEKAPNLHLKVKDVELALEKYCPDFDKNGNVHVDVFMIDLSKSNPDPQYVNMNSTKFFGEMQRGISQLFICDRDILGTDEQGNKVDFDSLFRDLGVATGLEEYEGQNFLKLNDTTFVKDAKWENSCPEILGFGIRHMTSNLLGYGDEALMRNEQAAQVLKNILTGNVINESKEG